MVWFFNMDSEQKNYELAYLLNPSLPEEDVLTWSNKLAALIEEARGVIRHSELPKKRQLSYPIKKTTTAYFGWLNFSTLPEEISNVNKRVKAIEQILRHLIIEVDVRDARISPRIFSAREDMHRRPTKEIRPLQRKKEEALDLETLDKKLEEILGK